MARRRTARPPRPADQLSPAPFVGMGLMAAALFLVGASLLVAPWYAVGGLALVWLAFFLVCVRWWTPHPARLPWVALASIAVWFGLLVGGTALL